MQCLEVFQKINFPKSRWKSSYEYPRQTKSIKWISNLTNIWLGRQGRWTLQAPKASLRPFFSNFRSPIIVCLSNSGKYVSIQKYLYVKQLVVNLFIQSECWKIRNNKNTCSGRFYALSLTIYLFTYVTSTSNIRYSDRTWSIMM